KTQERHYTRTHLRARTAAVRMMPYMDGHGNWLDTYTRSLRSGSMDNNPVPSGTLEHDGQRTFATEGGMLLTSEDRSDELDDGIPGVADTAGSTPLGDVVADIAPALAGLAGADATERPFLLLRKDVRHTGTHKQKHAHNTDLLSKRMASEHLDTHTRTC